MSFDGKPGRGDGGEVSDFNPRAYSSINDLHAVMQERIYQLYRELEANEEELDRAVQRHLDAEARCTLLKEELAKAASGAKSLLRMAVQADSSSISQDAINRGAEQMRRLRGGKNRRIEDRPFQHDERRKPWPVSGQGGGVPPTTADELHVAICQAVTCHNNGEPTAAAQILRHALMHFKETAAAQAEAKYPAPDGQVGTSSLAPSLPPAPAAAHFTDNGDGTVTDNTTGLMWKQAHEPGKYTWDQAMELQSDFAGHNDWSLPTIRELLSIVDYSRYNPAIDTKIFPNTPASYFWSASAYANNSGDAWDVSFYYGFASNYSKYTGYQVRLARAGQSFSSLQPASAATPVAWMSQGGDVSRSKKYLESMGFTDLVPLYDIAAAQVVSKLEASEPDKTVPAPAAAHFTDNGDGTVTDNTTGLMWKQAHEPGKYTWDQAIAIKSNFAGHDDWRLPIIHELFSIVDHTRYNPTIDTAVFPNTPACPSYFWSASAYAVYSGDAWGVNFGNGGAYSNDKGYDFQVRLVRAGQPFDPLALYTPTADFIDNGDGTVTHRKTGLMWKRCAEGQAWGGSTCTGSAAGYDWNTAVALTSSSAGHNDWRLPTANELLTIVEYQAYSPAINPTIFPNTPASYFWSASAYANNSGYAWYVGFDGGYAGYSYKSGGYQVRLVRDS